MLYKDRNRFGYRVFDDGIVKHKRVIQTQLMGRKKEVPASCMERVASK